MPATGTIARTAIEERARQQAEDAALMAVRLGLQPQITPEDLARGFDAGRLAGIEEAVAPMGTALTERQIELLWRLADKPILCFDGDAAGRLGRSGPRGHPAKATFSIVASPAGTAVPAESVLILPLAVELSFKLRWLTRPPALAFNGTSRGRTKLTTNKSTASEAAVRLNKEARCNTFYPFKSLLVLEELLTLNLTIITPISTSVIHTVSCLVGAGGDIGNSSPVNTGRGAGADVSYIADYSCVTGYAAG